MEELETGSFVSAADSCALEPAIRVVSWNINRGLQLPGIIEFLSKASADLILLQEADVNARRTQYRNIAREIAQALRMNYVFGREFEERSRAIPARLPTTARLRSRSSRFCHRAYSRLAGNKVFGARAG